MTQRSADSMMTPNTAESRATIARWLQREEEALCYQPDGGPVAPALDADEVFFAWIVKLAQRGVVTREDRVQFLVEDMVPELLAARTDLAVLLFASTEADLRALGQLVYCFRYMLGWPLETLSSILTPYIRDLAPEARLPRLAQLWRAHGEPWCVRALLRCVRREPGTAAASRVGSRVGLLVRDRMRNSLRAYYHR
jgi:hypothetical protein